MASNGGFEKINLNLERTGLRGYFSDCIVSAEHVNQPKACAGCLSGGSRAEGVPPQFCCVVEDSDVGALAGLSAGMRVLLFRPPWRSHPTAAPVGVEVFADMQELLGLILHT